MAMKLTVQKYRSSVVIVLVLILGFILGVAFSEHYAGKLLVKSDNNYYTINDQTATTTRLVDLAPFWKVWDLLDDKFVPTGHATTTTDQDRLWGAIAGLTSSLGDPYTVFMPPKEAADFETDISGNFEGVGMEIGIKNNILPY